VTNETNNGQKTDVTQFHCQTLVVDIEFIVCVQFAEN